MDYSERFARYLALRAVLDLYMEHLALHTEQLRGLRRGRVNRALV